MQSSVVFVHQGAYPADGKLRHEQCSREHSCVLLTVGKSICKFIVSSFSRGAGAAFCKQAAGKVNSVMSGSSKAGRCIML